MLYTPQAMDHFRNPRNVGELPDADGVAELGDAACGDVVKVWIQTDEERLTDVKYKVQGCPAMVALCSRMSELATGMPVQDVFLLTDERLVQELGGLPNEKLHCSTFAAQTLHAAVRNWHDKRLDAGELPVL